MTSNLVERLRNWPCIYPEDLYEPEGYLYEVAADRIEKLEATLKKLEYWFETDQDILDAMTPDEWDDHMRQLQMIRDTLTSGPS